MIRETTAFILALDEPFRFDLNNIQLGQLEDFKLQVFFDKQHRVYDESLCITAVGSPFEEVTSTKGLTGTIKFSEEYQPTQILMLNRAFGSVNQSIIMRFNLPKEQTLRYTFDFGQFEGQQSFFTTEVTRPTKNSISFSFNTGNWMPIGVKIDSYPPLWEQISVSEYLSFAGSLVLVMLTIVKGTPYYLRRRRINKLRRKLYSAAADNDWTSFEAVMSDASEKHINMKITAEQFKSLYFDSNLLKKRFAQP
ncbi:MAG: hypothetical protein ACTSW4_03560 [Candidatus Ranarchaeia archaeon]